MFEGNVEGIFLVEAKAIACNSVGSVWHELTLLILITTQEVINISLGLYQ